MILVSPGVPSYDRSSYSARFEKGLGEFLAKQFAKKANSYSAHFEKDFGEFLNFSITFIVKPFAKKILYF